MLYLTGCGNSTGTDSRNNSTEGTFRFLALENREIHELRHADQLFAGTSQGLVRLEMTSGEVQSTETFMEQAGVRTFVFIDETTWLISAVFSNNSDSSNIYRTTNRGESWQMFNNGFGGNEKWIPAMMDNYKDRPQTIFARTPGRTNVGRTDDAGQSWESVVGTWDNPNLGTNRFVKVDPHNPEVVWAGGASALFQPNLWYSTDNGKEWSGFLVIENVETTVFDIISRSNNTEELLAGLSGIIRKSTDGGESWKTVFGGIRIRTMAQSVRDNNTVYVSGLAPSSRPFFAVSFDFGNNWEMVEFENGPDNIVVNDMLSVMESETEVLYFATNKGVYSFRFDK